MVQISTRGTNMPASPIRKLKPYADAAKAQGKSIYHLNIGQPDIQTPGPMLKKLKEIDKKVIAYGPSQGLPEYLDALREYYARHNIILSPEQLIVTTGGSEAIIMAFTVCLDHGDEILIPEPFYANYNGFAAATDILVKPITTKIENDWQLPAVDEIEKLIGQKTKAIMICNPNNPTGKVYDKEELQKLVDLAAKHNLFIFADEVYREFIYNESEHISLLHFKEVEQQVVIMDSISKRFSSCGARIGAFISKNPQIMKAALAFAQARLCPPTIAQYLAIPSIQLDQDYFDKVLAEYKKRRDVVIDWLKSMDNVKFKVPQGAFYITIALPVKNAEKFVTWLLQDFHINNETLMLAPANGFYSTPGLGENEVRIAFVLDAKKMAKAMNILKEGLQAYPG